MILVNGYQKIQIPLSAIMPQKTLGPAFPFMILYMKGVTNPDFWVILYVTLWHAMIMCLICVIESCQMLLCYSNIDYVLA